MAWLTLASSAIAFGAGLAARGLWKLSAAARARTQGLTSERRTDIVMRLDEYKHVIESAGIGTFFWDPQGDTIRWSQHHYVSRPAWL